MALVADRTKILQFGGNSVGGESFPGKQALRLDYFDGDEPADAGVIAGRAEEIGFGVVDDPFANGVLVDMSDPVHKEPGLSVLDPKGAAAILPKLVFLQPPEGFTIFFETLEHPIAAQVHFDFDGFQQCGGGIFFKVPFEPGGRCTVLCPEHEVQVAAHETPGIKVEALHADNMVQGIGNCLFVSGPYEQIDLIYYIECQEITGVKGEDWLFIRKHTLTCLN